MSYQDLQALGAFVPVKPTKQTITAQRPVMTDAAEWDDPNTPEFTGDTEEVSIDVWMKRMSSADEIALARAKPEDRPFVMAARLVRNEDGSPLFESEDQASTMAGWILAPLVKRIEEMAGASTKKKTPKPKMTSGSNSQSDSVAAVRRNGKK